MSDTAFLSPRRWSWLARSVRVLLGAVLLTTCSTDTIGPGGRVVGVMRAGALLQAAAEFAIPIDEVRVDIRRVSDDGVVFSRTLSSGEFGSDPDELRIEIRLTLEARTEDFAFVVTARSGGVDYYQASGTITAVAYETVTTSPLVPVYVGPGANADAVAIPQATSLGNGESATLTAVVSQAGTPIPGVPVSFQSSDPLLITPVQQGLNAAAITAPATGRGSVVITARTPTNLSTTGTVDWAPRPSVLVPIGGDGQTVNTNSTAAAPLVVEVQDAQGGPVPGTQVSFAVTAGPAGTSVAPLTATSDAQGRAQTILTAGNTPGAITVTASSPGLTPVSFSATAVTTVGVPTTVTANSPTTQTAGVNSAVAAPPSVIVRDAQGTAVPNVTVAFALTGGGGSLTGGTQTTNSSGIATVGSWTVGTVAGPNTMTATVGTLPVVTFTANGTAGPPVSLTLVQGDNQTAASGTPLPVPLTVLAQDGFNNPAPGATVTWAPTDGSASPPSGPTAANGQASTTWTLGAGQLTPTLTASVPGAGSVTFHATTTFTAPTILLSTGGNPLVGVGLSTTVNVTLSQAAGVNGVTLTLSSDNGNTISVPTPSLFIAQGAATGSFQVNGVSAGLTTIRAQAPGYTAGAIDLTATLQIISLPVTLNVPFGQNQNFPVSLAVPAPAGGVTVQIATSDATRVAVVTTSVNIPANSQVGTATVFGQFPGPATLTAQATGFVGASTAAQTTALLNIVQGSATLNASFGTTVTVELRSGATTVPAPAGGLVVSLQALNAACLAVPATATIPQGLVNTTATLTYGGTATLPCNTQLVASAPNITPDTIPVTVNVQPGINLNTPGQFTGRLGAGLQDGANGNLAVATPVATTVRITSGDPTRVLIAPDASTPGTDFIDVPVPANQSFFSYYTQGVGVSTGPVTITASSAGYSNGTTGVTVASPALDLSNVITPTTTLAPTSVFTVRVGVPNANNTSMQALQALTVGSPAATLTVANGDPTVGKLVTSALTADIVTLSLPPGVTQTPNTVVGGGVAFDPQAAGTTTVSVTAPGFVVLPTATATITVNQPNITLNTPAQFTGRVGVGLQDQGNGTLQNPTPSATTVRLTSGDPTKFLLAPDAATAGAPFIDLPLAAGSSFFSYYIQGLALTTGAVPITAAIAGYNQASVNVTIADAGLDIGGLGTTATSLAPNTVFTVRIGVVTPGGTGLQALQAVRAGQPAVTTTVTSSDTNVAQVITLPDSSSPVSVTIPVDAFQSPNTVAAGGVAFDPKNAGTTAINVTAPGFAVLTGATVNVTVSAPNIFLNTPAQFTGRLGNGLQDGANGSLQSSPGGTGTTLTITASDTNVVKFAPDNTTAGSGILTIPISPTGSGFSYVVQGFGTSPTPITIMASAPGYNSATVPITVVQPGLILSGLATTTTTFSATAPFAVAFGPPNTGASGLSANQALRIGATPVQVDISNSNGTVAQLVTTAVTGNQVSVMVNPGQFSSPGTVAQGGVGFDPLVAGSTTVAATATGFVALPGATQAVTVTAPNITLNTPGQFTGQVGAGLQDAASGGFQVATPGALTLHIESSNPSVALVSPDAGTAGLPAIDIPINAGATSLNYYIQGVEGATGTVQISATAPGYNTGVVNVTIAQPALQLSGLVSPVSSTAANDPFQALIGVPNSNRTSMAAFQAIRAGGTALTVTIQNSNGTAGTLVTGTTTPVSGNTATVTIQIGANASPPTRAGGGIEFDPLAPGTTTVSATAPPFLALPSASVTVTVQ